MTKKKSFVTLTPDEDYQHASPSVYQEWNPSAQVSNHYPLDRGPDTWNKLLCLLTFFVLCLRAERGIFKKCRHLPLCSQFSNFPRYCLSAGIQTLDLRTTSQVFYHSATGARPLQFSFQTENLARISKHALFIVQPKANIG
jgi:hypothetical protein